MKILLDNCVHRKVAALLPGHEVLHASRVGMAALSNGALMMAAASAGFEVLMTVDQKIRHEHRLDRLPIAVCELDTRDSRLPAITLMSPHFEKALASTRSHRFVSLNRSGELELLAPAPDGEA